MKHQLTKLFLLLILSSNCFLGYSNNSDNDTEIQQLLSELSTEVKQTKAFYFKKKNVIYIQIKSINKQLVKDFDTDTKLNLLIKKDFLRDKLQGLEEEELSKIQKIRYLKGLSIIKILYEKVLSLDHHFSTVATFSEINKIANPNNYPEFIQVRDIIKEKKHKKIGLNLTSILGQNIYTSSIDMIVSLFNSDASSSVKEDELKKVECIMDFTLRMNNDLNTIYFETAFLQKSNNKMIRDIQTLFKDYTKPIKYFTSLKDCRNNDDWSVIREKLNQFLEQLNTAINKDKKSKVMQMQIDINFPIDRLMQFITQYDNFIKQGANFYEKFKIILNSYENEQQCSSSFPISYKKLKSDIDVSIEKFNTAYKPVEINGSKMKELLYGIDEYQ
jgi:hypothetical protein